VQAGAAAGKLPPVREAKPSATAQHVALARAHLTEFGVLDDDLAQSMLRRPWAIGASLLRRRRLARFGRNRAFAYLAARTQFYDDAVAFALDEGTRQVVVIGAGYDSRAWRFARPGVQFFEVDQAATQADKQRRAPSGGPRYVAADIGNGPLRERLRASGFIVGAPTMFTLEGVTMYLTQDQVVALLTELAEIGGPGSRLVANFGVGFDGDPSRRRRGRARLGRAFVKLGGESFRFELAPADARSFVARTGWTVEDMATGPQLGARYLDGSTFPVMTLNPRAFVVSALRTGEAA
jgi:methyltransferase (TIGR00027 family)